MSFDFEFANPYRDTQQEPPAAHCAECQREIYSESTCYLVGCHILCDECISNFNAENSEALKGRDLHTYIHKQHGGTKNID